MDGDSSKEEKSSKGDSEQKLSKHDMLKKEVE